MSEQRIEEMIRERGLTAPRITPEYIDELITGEQYYQFPGTTVTVCALTLQNGYTVVGYSAAASPENFNAEIGQTIAREDARDKIWPLAGYALRESLSRVGENT